MTNGLSVNYIIQLLSENITNVPCNRTGLLTKGNPENEIEHIALELKPEAPG